MFTRLDLPLASKSFKAVFRSEVGDGKKFWTVRFRLITSDPINLSLNVDFDHFCFLPRKPPLGEVDKSDISIEKCRICRFNRIMTPQQELKLKKKKVFTLAEAEAIGLSRQDIAKLVKQEKLLRMGRGIYSHPQAPVDREIDFQVACSKLGPDVVVGGLSALYYYNLTEQLPQQVWVLVPSTKKTRSKDYRLIRTKTPLNKGIIQGQGYKIVSLERAIVESFKLATKIGERIAIKAAKTAIQQKRTNLKRIGTTAREIGLDSYFTKYFEAIIGSIT